MEADRPTAATRVVPPSEEVAGLARLGDRRSHVRQAGDQAHPQDAARGPAASTHSNDHEATSTATALVATVSEAAHGQEEEVPGARRLGVPALAALGRAHRLGPEERPPDAPPEGTRHVGREERPGAEAFAADDIATAGRGGDLYGAVDGHTPATDIAAIGTRDIATSMTTTGEPSVGLSAPRCSSVRCARGPSWSSIVRTTTTTIQTLMCGM